MSNTLHIFGDSFSAGVGVDIEQGTPPHVPKTYKSYSQFAFYKNIKGYKVVNHAVAGASNELISVSLMKALPTIKKGDMVVVGLTEWARVSVPLKKNKKHITLDLNLTGGFFLEHIQEKRLDYIEHLKKETGITEEQINVAFKFYELLTFPQKYADLKKDYYVGAVTQFGNHLYNLGVKFYMWDYTLWELFENMSTWSDGEYPDGNWSPNGNRSFLGLLLWGIHTNTTYLNASVYKSNKKQVIRYMLEIGLDQYIQKPSSRLHI